MGGGGACLPVLFLFHFVSAFDYSRPYFTYWATFVQIVVFIVAVAVYGTAPFGVGKHTEQKMVRV